MGKDNTNIETAKETNNTRRLMRDSFFTGLVYLALVALAVDLFTRLLIRPVVNISMLDMPIYVAVCALSVIDCHWKKPLSKKIMGIPVLFLSIPLLLFGVYGIYLTRTSGISDSLSYWCLEASTASAFVSIFGIDALGITDK